MPAIPPAAKHLRVLALAFAFVLALSAPAGAAGWRELTADQQEMFRQAVEEGGVSDLTAPATPQAKQMYLDLRNDSDPKIRELFFIMRQKAGTLPRPYTMGYVYLYSGDHRWTVQMGGGTRAKWFRFDVAPMPSAGPPWGPYGLVGVDHCGYANAVTGFEHPSGVWDTPYHAGDLVPNCPDRTVATMGYSWPNGGRASEAAGPNPPEDGFMLAKESTRTIRSVNYWDEPCGTNYPRPTGYETMVGGKVTGCVGPRYPNCTGDGHVCYPHAHGHVEGYFRETVGTILQEGSGPAPIFEGDTRKGYGSDPIPVDRAAIDREMLRIKNQPLVDWLHRYFMNANLSYFAPQLRYEEQEGYKAGSAAMATDNYVPGSHANELVDWDNGFPIPMASPDPATTLPRLSLDYLGETYPNGVAADRGTTVPGGHLIDIKNSYSDDVQRMWALDRYRHRMYGRAVKNAAGETWLQYWLFYYMNDSPWAGEGDHEGDWEMIQVKLDNVGQPVLATYSQHGGGGQETCSWNRVDKHESSGTPGDHPIVYVDGGTHASLFVPKWGHVGGERLIPRMSEISDSHPRWVRWPGLWGASETAVRSPAWNGAGQIKWERPWEFDLSTDTCPKSTPGTINPARKAKRRPRPSLRIPRVSAVRAGDRVRIRYSVSGLSKRELRQSAIYLSVHPRDRRRLPTSNQLRLSAASGSATLDRPRGAGPFTVRASLRRGEYTHSKIASVRLR